MGNILMKLFIAGESPNTQQLETNLDSLLYEKFGSDYSLEVVDIVTHPEVAVEEKIFATPTLVKSTPLPAQKIIGDMSDKDKIKKSIEILLHKQ